MGVYSKCPRKAALFQLRAGALSWNLLAIWTTRGPATAQVRPARCFSPCDCCAGRGHEVACRTQGGTGVIRWPQNHATQAQARRACFLAC